MSQEITTNMATHLAKLRPPNTSPVSPPETKRQTGPSEPPQESPLETLNCEIQRLSGVVEGLSAKVAGVKMAVDGLETTTCSQLKEIPAHLQKACSDLLLKTDDHLGLRSLVVPPPAGADELRSCHVQFAQVVAGLEERSRSLITTSQLAVKLAGLCKEIEDHGFCRQGPVVFTEFLKNVRKEVEWIINRAKETPQGSSNPVDRHERFYQDAWETFQKRLITPGLGVWEKLIALTNDIGLLVHTDPNPPKISDPKAPDLGSLAKPDYESTRIDEMLDREIRGLVTLRDQLKKRGDDALSTSSDRQRGLESARQELRHLREGRLAELQFVKQRAHSKIEKLKALHQREIDALVMAFRG